MTTEAPNIVVSTRMSGASSDKTILETLLKMGLARKVVSQYGMGCEVTTRGLQAIADYEYMQHELDMSTSDTFSDLSAKSTAFIGPEIIGFLHTLTESEEKTSHLARVSILIPALNEAKNLESLLRSIHTRLPEVSEIIVVEGKSVDDTAIVASTLGAKVLVQQATGKGDAMRQGFASSHTGDIIVMMDADGSNRPEEIPQLVEAVVNGADIAKGSRFLSGGGSVDLTRIRKVGNKLFVSLVNLFWSGQYTDICYGFLAFRKPALKQLAPLLESVHFQLETEICIKARKLNLKVVEVPSNELKRRHGNSKLRGVNDSMSIAKTLCRELFSSS
ncbi:MAG TPA: glycosyltransferase family 2 protein [Candidatus Bathyarchaeia archaeon]|nr:glycosyltransferase family 2 protein [Candidatus Bathyarchaeia archaeon]